MSVSKYKNRYEIEVLNDAEAIKAVSKSIDLLNQDASNGSIFLLSGFINRWCDYFYSEKDDVLNFLIIREDGVMVSYAPLYFCNKTLMFMLTGDEEEDEVCAEYMDFVVRDGYEAIVLDVYAFYFENIINKNITIDFTNYLHTSFINTYIIPMFLQNGRRIADYSAGLKYYIKLPDSVDAFKKKYKGSFYDGLRSKLKKLNAYKVNILVNSNGDDEYKHVFNVMCDFHTARWKKRGLGGVFGSRKFRIFHESLLAYLVENNMLYMFRLQLDDVDVSILYCFLHKKQVHFYQAGYQSVGYEKLSLGSLTHYLAMEDCIARNIDVYDFMLGPEDNYKKRFKCSEDAASSCVIYPSTVMGFLRYYKSYFAKNVRYFCKRFLARFSSRSV